MFDKILIANRGEIACRVIDSARRMGIGTVAVYSDADARARHVKLADEAVRIGPAASSESYLKIDRLVDACRSTHAQAVHPGYGFLSENATFAAALGEAGVVFIGPGQRAITAMGDKIASKRIAVDAGVNTIPGSDGAVESQDQAVAVAQGIGYPVMIKASAGGGGKGMRVAWDDDGCRDGFERARSEAASSFGDERVFIEKFIEEPRHIEIQIIADTHGNVVYLGERECSIQRRHQKVIEEAPSPFLDEATRVRMGEQAAALARAVDYHSAGTVEFIVDAQRNFYFLEMNTRLQVEHPVTELVTGQDLVELMIRVAVGETLPFKQVDVTTHGWAVEARLYAEDPERNFLPSIGRLSRFRVPTESAGIRLDTGVEEGDSISMFYDPMIAKLVAYGDDRAQAAERLSAALDRTEIRGVANNASFLTALLRLPRFAQGRLDTNLIEQTYPDGYDATKVPEDEWRLLAAVALVLAAREARRERRISGQMEKEAVSASPRCSLVALDGAHQLAATVEVSAETERVEATEQSFEILSAWSPGDNVFTGEVDGQAVFVQVQRVGVSWRLSHRGFRTTVLVTSPRGAELQALMPVKAPPDLSRFVLSPMPGLLLNVSVAEGEAVKAGQALAVVEAMKMENVLRAEQDGVVKQILAETGASLAVDEPIIEFA